MDNEQAQLVHGRPRYVAGLTSATLVSLGDRSFDRDRYVAEMLPLPGRRLVRRFDRTPDRLVVRLAGVRRKGGRRQKREGQHIGRTMFAHVLVVETGQLTVVGEDQGNARR